jgi:subtilisin family serine protease
MYQIKLLCLFLLLATAVSAQKSSSAFVPDEILVKFSKRTRAEGAQALSDRFGATLVETLGDLGWTRIRVPNGLTVEQTIALYRETGEVESAQPNFYYRLALTPNDTQFGSMYGLTKISAPAAWDLTTGSSSVVVADIDTGLRYTHEDLAANSWTNPGEINNNGIDDDLNGFVDDFYGYDFRYNDSNPIDENGHGTHTAGTIGAVGNNALGVTGVNWNVKIMAIKIYSPSGTDSTSAMLVNAYNYVRLMKQRGINIRVTNNSYGDCPESCGYDQATRDALEELGNAGVLNVFAAGNSARNIDTGAPFYPASYDLPTILSVASSTSTDARSGFSNFGATSVDLAAPGSSILSTTFSTNSTYGSLSGTSMATPHVAGAAALLSAYNPNLSAASLKATLMNTVDPLVAWAGVVKTGGRLNVSNALLNQTVCTFGLAQNSMNVRLKGGIFTLGVTAAPNCDYSAKSNAGWVSVSGPTVFSGNGTVTFRVASSPTISRTGTITIGGQTFTLTQSRN